MNHTKLAESLHSNPKIIKVKIERGNSTKKEFYFENTFTVGRSEECSIQIDEGVVSRVHIEVIKENETWWIYDKHSSNGTFLNGNKIDRIELKNTTSIELGNNGPILLFTFGESIKPSADKKKEIVEVVHDTSDNPSITKYIRHYFNESNEGEVGEHTKLMREAFKVVKKKHTSKYIKIIIAVAFVAILIGVYAIYQQIKENEQKQLAENIFYDMKSLELEIASLKENLASSKDPAIIKALQKFDERMKLLRKSYEKVVDDLGIYNLKEEDKLIIQTARVFGECELIMPNEFMDEVKNYINRWKASNRYIKALDRAKQSGYIPVVVNYLIREQLPVQFFYLALQESDFREQIVGPQTRYGFAKGIWQFIPQTAQKYGLKIGPLSNLNVYDPGDDRFNFPKATSAATRYIKDIYNTDAQASGLLVMASYNWGEYNIINLIRTMPSNPRERNFWKLLEKYKDKIPNETYNYVFYIFSAAVIGENPKLFGFDFDNPLEGLVSSIQ